MYKQLRFLTTMLLLAVCCGTWAQTTYKLTQVTSVEAGGLYVFEQGGYVMNNTVSSNALQTTNTYKTTGLTGEESYVWILKAANDGFYMKNNSLTESNGYLNNTASKTNLSFGTSSATTIWSFSFQQDATVIIKNIKNSNRFLGYTDANSHAYRAYAASNLDDYSHAIKVYKLEEETGGETPSLQTNDLALTGNTNLSFDLYNNASAQTISYTTSSTGAISVAQSNYATFVVDQTAKTIAVTPTAVTNGAQTITVNQAADATYAAGSATFTLTVINSAPVIDYATLPFSFNAGKSAIDNISGLTQSGLGSDYNSAPYLKFDTTGDNLILKINEVPGILTFDIKGNSFSGGTFKVQTSVDGETYTDLATYTSLGDTQTETFEDINANVRYIKWIYTTKSSGNVALGNISLTKETVKRTLTVASNNGTVAITGRQLQDNTCNIPQGSSVTATATPDDQYTFISWTATGVELTDATANPLTFNMPENDVTLTANFSKVYTPSDLALTGTPVDLSFNIKKGQKALTIDYTTSGTGAVTVSGGDVFVTTSVDETNKTITVTPVSTTTSAQTLTVSQAADDNYAAGSVTFTVEVASEDTDAPTWDLSAGSYEGAPDENEIIWHHNAVDMKVEKGNSETSVNSYIPTAHNSTRFYAGQKLTITPAEGYTVAKVQFTAVTTGFANALAACTWTGATVANEGHVVTVTPNNVNEAFSATINSLCELTAVTVEYEEIPIHNYTFYVQGEEVSTGSVREGEAITFPEAPAGNSFFSFVGWATTEITGTTDTAPETVTSAVMGERDMFYHAVFAKSEETLLTATFDASDISNLTETDTRTWKDNATGIELYISAGQRYTSGTPNTWTVTKSGSVDHFMSVGKDGVQMKKVTVNVTATDYAVGDFYVYADANDETGTDVTSSVVTEGTTSTLNVSGNYEMVVMWSGTSNQIRATQVSVEASEMAATDYCTMIPEPSITVTDADISVTAEGDVDTRAITYEYLDITDATDFALFFYDSDDNQLRGDDEPKWIEVEVAEENGSYMISYLVNANTSAERTAYFKVAAAGDEDFIFSNLVTVTQAAGPSATATIATACTDGKGKYYGTYSNTRAFILPEGVTASEISIIDGKLYVEDYDAGATVPANTGVMISSETAGEKTFYLTTGGTSVLGSRNMLHATGNGITAAEMAPSESPDCLYYRLTMHNGTTIGFWWGAEDGAAFSVGANKAYLAVPANQAKDGFAFGNDGGATSISTIDNGQLTMENAYNLQGQKVGSAYRGIVIVNGKARINK